MIMALLLLPVSVVTMTYTCNQSLPESGNDAIIANTSSEMSPFDNANGQLITICGARKSSLQQFSLYHCIILYPKGELIDQGSKTSTEGVVSTLTDTWKIQKSLRRGQKSIQEGSLIIKYNASNKSISVDSDEYEVAKGNLFVIRFDGKERAKVKQVLATLDGCVDAEEVLNFYKKVLPDREIKSLKLF